MIHSKAIWHERKRNRLGLPWTFTVYEADENKLYINTGVINLREDEVRLYRITDMTLTRSLWQRLIGTGTIHCNSSDPMLGNFDLKNIRKSNDVKQMLSELVEKARMKARVYAHENVNGKEGFMGAMSGNPEDAEDLDGDGIPDAFANPGDLDPEDAAEYH